MISQYGHKRLDRQLVSKTGRGDCGHFFLQFYLMSAGGGGGRGRGGGTLPSKDVTKTTNACGYKRLCCPKLVIIVLDIL